MQPYAALVISAVLAASAPMTQRALHFERALPDTSEVYVAELDADWNVAREIRQPCGLDRGCTVNLGLTQGRLGRIHVRFDAAGSGRIAVNSVLEDQAGKPAAQPVMMLALDTSGFGAGHYAAVPVEPIARRDAAAATVSGTEAQPIILVAVRAPGWVAPVSPSIGDRT